MYSAGDTLAGGLPHSDVHGSTPARGSPWLFAACHVLHRLLVPRHPPNALLALEILNPLSRALDPPCTGAIHTQDPDANHPATRQASNSAHTFHASERQRCCRWPPHPPHGGRTYRSDFAASEKAVVDHSPLAARPETHQNLIHTDKDHTPGHPDGHHRLVARHTPQGEYQQATPELGFPL